DNAAAAAEAMDHLYRLGHRHIGVVTGPLVSPLRRARLAGATARARAERAEHTLAVVHGDFSIEAGAGAGPRVLDRREPPTAVFCFSDEMAMGLIEAARERGVRVPRDLSVIGFDDIRFARHMDPPLTTIAQPMREIGAGTVRILVDILAGRTIAPLSVTLP